jgi:hypothetical protein
MDGVRLGIVIAAVIAALGSATSGSQPQQQQSPAYAQPQQQQFSPCEYACGQVARCNIGPYDACLAQCRANGTEQQPGGAQQLNTLATTSCEQMQAMMQSGAQPQTATTTPATMGQGDIEVDYAAPLGYAQSQQGSSIVFTPSQLNDKTPCVYGIAASRRSSGSLENDAAAALMEALPGWQRGQGAPTQMRGYGPGGWAYHWIRASVQRLNNGSYEYMNAMAMAFPASAGRVNIMFGFGTNVYCLADDASFGRLFYSLAPRGWRSDGGKQLRADLLGGWRMDAGGAYRSATKIYVFRDDGRYFDVLQTTTEAGMWETTRTGTGDGNWGVVEGGTLVITPDRKPAERFRVRIYDELTSGGGTWRHMMMLREGSTEYRELDFERMSWK